MSWAFVLLLVLADGETREVRFKGYETWQSCERARIAQIQTPMADELDGRVILACVQLKLRS